MYSFYLSHILYILCIFRAKYSHACVLSCFSRVWLFEIPWTVEHQAPLSTGFSRQEYWSGLPCPPPEDLPDPGIVPVSCMFPALTGGFFTTSTTWEGLSVLCEGPQFSSICANIHPLLHIISRYYMLIWKYETWSLQFSCSVVSDFCDPVDCSMSSFPIHHQLLELAQTHVH